MHTHPHHKEPGFDQRLKPPESPLLCMCFTVGPTYVDYSFLLQDLHMLIIIIIIIIILL